MLREFEGAGDGHMADGIHGDFNILTENVGSTGATGRGGGQVYCIVAQGGCSSDSLEGKRGSVHRLV